MSCQPHMVTSGHVCRNKSQHRKLTFKKKILPPLLPELELETFRSRVRRSNHCDIPALITLDGENTPIPTMVHSPDFFPETLKYFSLRVTLFCMALVEQLGDDSWSVVCAACCHMALVFAIMYLCNIF